MDLIDVGNISEQNRGVKYLLCCVDVFSRYGWVIPLKSKTADSVSDALTFFLNVTSHIPTNLTSDHGGEFVNEKVRTLLKSSKLTSDIRFRKTGVLLWKYFKKLYKEKYIPF